LGGGGPSPLQHGGELLDESITVWNNTKVRVYRHSSPSMAWVFIDENPDDQ
jgi:hypothetical protein